METLKTVHIYTVLEVKVPQLIPVKEIELGLAGCKVLRRFEPLPEAEVLTWWIQDVVPCQSRYVTCSRCLKIGPVAADAVVLDGQPLCIHCSAEFIHGDLPQPRTPEQLKAQLGRK